MKKKAITRLRDTSGETITETLVSLLIVVLAMTMLAGSIVAAAKVNKRIEDESTAFNAASAVETTESITINGKNVSVTVYTTADGVYTYYKE